MRAARPLPFDVPIGADGVFVVTLRETSTHKKIIVRDDGDGSILWESNWSAAGATESGGMWSVTFTVPKVRVSAARTAKLTGKTIVIEVWLRHPLPEGGTVDVLEFGLDLKL